MKALFNHHAFRDRVRLSGVNSINWARIVAQTVYYFTAAVALGAPHAPVAFTVPTGNFGDIFAGYVARRMGLPIDRLVIATNVNDILARTLATGAYEVRGVTRHLVAVDGHSGVVEFRAARCSRPPSATPPRSAALMASLDAVRSAFDLLAAALIRAIRAVFDAGRADENETAATIRAALARSRASCTDPHTAVARRASRRRKPRNPPVPMVMLSTAHPAKFPDAVEALAACVRPCRAGCRT